MSGMRNDPPISISSPRETITSPPSARVLRARKTAAALLFTTRERSAPSNRVSKRSVCWSRWPRSPFARSYSRLEYCPEISAMWRTASAASGARPRLVCRMTPVALMTGRREGPASPSAAARISCSRLSTETAESSPLVILPRTPCRTLRVQSISSRRPTRDSSSRSAGRPSNSSTAGICRSSESSTGLIWASCGPKPHSVWQQPSTGF